MRNLFFIFLLIFALQLSAQGPQKTTAQIFKNISLKTDTMLYEMGDYRLSFNGQNYFFFRAESRTQIIEGRLFPHKTDFITNLELLPSSDFDIIDSITLINNEHYRFKIQYNNITQVQHPSLIFKIGDRNGDIINHEIKLHPFFIPTVQAKHESIELFAGEEKTIEIRVPFAFNISTENTWEENEHFEYKVSKTAENLRIQVKPKSTGAQNLVVNLKTISPILSDSNTLTHEIPPLILAFNIKPSRLQFINTDKETIFHDPNSMKTEEIQIDYHSGFQMRRTYRIENRQEAGGQLIAEITPKSVVGNRIICDIRTYFLHRMNSGYLYIKDANRTLFMTNFNIVYRPEITKIQILREGKDWTNNLSVFPGEKIEVKIEGSGLLHTLMEFDGCMSKKDTVRLSDQVVFYYVSIPADIPRRKIALFMNKSITQHELLVREHQKPAPFDFININYGDKNYAVTDEYFNKPILYASTIRDINVIFDNNKIDSQDELLGKQYVNIEVRLLDDKNRLVDIQQINNIVVCPGTNSLRHAFYDASDCNAPILNLNDYLIRKTYHLDAFSQIVITFKHNENRYSGLGHTRKITIILERKSKFDIQVSFPAGLLVKEFKDKGIGNLSGISTSVLAEFSFYDKKQIGRIKPYRIGAGFIALNAFNFNESPNITRDIGIVLMTAIEPVNKNAKFSVPIYLGAGYLLKNNDFFAIFGPGIRFQF